MMLNRLSLVKNSPAVRAATVATTLSATVFGGIAYVDYHRPIVKSGNFVPKSGTDTHVGESMDNYHCLVVDKELTYATIVSKAECCEESYYVYECALRKVEKLKIKPGFRSEDIEKTVALEYQQFVCKMARRALIRNGYYIMWAKAVAQDEFVKVFVLPAFAWIVRMAMPGRHK
jgi:hypothetical protein